MKNKWYKISDLHEFVKSARILVFNAFGKDFENILMDNTTTLPILSQEEKTELDNVLTQAESMIIAGQFIKTKTNDVENFSEHFITEDKFMLMLEDLNSRLVSNLLHNLVNRGLLEMAFDEEQNDFVFWSPQSNIDPKNEKDKES